MKNRRLAFTRAACALVAACLGPGSLRAAEFLTITVPVDYSNLHPSITAVGVSCRVYLKDPATLQRRMLTYKTSNVPSVGGHAAGNAVLIFRTEDFDLADQKNLGLVKDGECSAGLIANDGKNYTPNFSATPMLGAKPGAPLKFKTTFLLP